VYGGSAERSKISGATLQRAKLVQGPTEMRDIHRSQRILRTPGAAIMNVQVREFAAASGVQRLHRDYENSDNEHVLDFWS
jgi:hypothetical protein